MENHNENHNKKKKGILASILESMIKTGGCCGSGGSCECKTAPDKNKQDKNKNDKQDGPRES